MGSNLIDVGCHGLAVDLLLSNPILINAHASKHGTSPRVDLGTTVTDNAHDNLLPRLLAPRFALLPVTHVLDILENATHRSRKENVIFVVHGHDNEEFCVSWFGEKALAQGEFVLIEFGGVAGCGRIAHMCELVSLRRLHVRYLVEQLGRNGAVQHEITVEQLHGLNCPPPSDRRRAGLLLALDHGRNRFFR
jgi:hypothetical protein